MILHPTIGQSIDLDLLGVFGVNSSKFSGWMKSGWDNFFRAHMVTTHGVKCFVAYTFVPELRRNYGILTYVHVPRTCECPLFLGFKPPKRWPFTIKTKITWVPGTYTYNYDKNKPLMEVHLPYVEHQAATNPLPTLDNLQTSWAGVLAVLAWLLTWELKGHKHHQQRLTNNHIHPRKQTWQWKIPVC